MTPDTTAAPLGARVDGGGVSFRLWSGAATRAELCLFDAEGRASSRQEMEREQDGVWRCSVPEIGPGQQYGYRLDGPWDPRQGLRFNAAKLLLDPYARALAGAFQWHPAVFDYEPAEGLSARSERDSAAFVPKSVVVADGPRPAKRPRVAWADTVIYETNVRGFTMRHPALSERERGRFAGLRNGAILEYLRALGITSVELMPIHAFVDERALCERGLRNFWGYNSVGFFAPASRYAAGDDPCGEFREMVDALHDAGFEVILDVVYNHTGESDRFGPTLCFRGIDNLAYYRTVPGKPGRYVDDTGCGNTINADHPRVASLVLDSLRYWAGDMGVDGFRFDLATVIGRRHDGFDPAHPLLAAIGDDALLRDVKLIAEPWDPGPGGYQLGGFPAPWAEWNDRYRDSVRRFWRGDKGEAAEFARRLHGSADLFESNGRKPSASINFVSSHDGFTLADVVSYKRRHNAANGEDNADGHRHNFSANHGVEGPAQDADIVASRRRHRLGMLATLMFSQGTPMLLAGDEFGNSQSGNNNAYAQDNDIGWLDWSALIDDRHFMEEVARLIALRRELPQFRPQVFLHDDDAIRWWHPQGRPMRHDDWPDCEAFGVVLIAADASASASPPPVVVLFNRGSHEVGFRLPGAGDTVWECLFDASGTPGSPRPAGYWPVGPGSCVLARQCGRNAADGQG